MFGKLLLVIVVIGAVACVLLVNRQRRIETAHETATLYRQVVQRQHALWILRSDIAERCHPDRVRQSALSLNESWSPVPRMNP